MPELAEVEYFRRQWNPAFGSRVIGIKSNSGKRIFRGTDVEVLEKTLTGAKMLGSEGSGKQMLFRFSRDASLGIHLGMSGTLRVEAVEFTPGRHDHLVLFQKERSLVYSDFRMFGRIRFTVGKGPPEWWSKLPPPVLSSGFTLAKLSEQLDRRRRSLLKAVLLDQTLFPGIGNWMADEIMWRIKVHPVTRSSDLSILERHELWRTSRAVCRVALKTIGVDWGQPPKKWLVHHRWTKRGRCPRDGVLLDHATIAGRSTAWCPTCQKPSLTP